MDDNGILELVREAMVYISVPNATERSVITLNDKLSDLGIDSILALEMAAYMEEKLEVQFPDEELSSLIDVRGIVQLVRRHLNVLT
jgi:acyl carrier protein